MKLSILICTIPERFKMWNSLITDLIFQLLDEDDVEILSEPRDFSIGRKRNILLSQAQGEYLCFIDDDDEVSSNYIELLMKAIDSDCDCASLKGMYSVDGIDEGIFEHSIKYKVWKTNPEGSEIRYERSPNHLNMIRSSIAKQFKFPEINHGEDHAWSTKLLKSGLLKKEFYIPEVIYYYRKITNHVQPAR